MIGNTSHDRDKLLVTGIAPVAPPLTRPSARPVPQEETEAAPVFVDATGWRARIGRRLGLLVGSVLLVFLGALGLGVTTGADVPLTPWSEPSVRPRAKVSRPSVPAEKAGERAPSARPQPAGPGARSSRGPASRRPSGLRKTTRDSNSLAHRTTWLRSDLSERPGGEGG
ncbi:hypothetical protein GCM10023178_73740 [Actinomadura luteofluorescens]